MPTRFIILCTRRTGSSLLVSSLAEHPHARIYGEVFNPDAVLRETASRNALYQEEGMYVDGTDAADYLDRVVFGRLRPDHVQAVGFKIFYDYARTDPQACRAWDYLADHGEVRVIHLTRRNMLESLVSERIAHATGEWSRQAGTASEPRAAAGSISLTPQECRTYFRVTESHQSWARATFERHARLELEYQRDLCERFEETMIAIQEFLGLRPCPLPKRLEKQATQPLEQRVANLGALQRCFRGTQYEELFGSRRSTAAGWMGRVLGTLIRGPNQVR